MASYAFVFPNEEGVAHRMLLPLLDILNHGNEDTANVQIMEADNGDIYAYTLRDVKAGEEVRLLHLPPHACSSSAGFSWQPSRLLDICLFTLVIVSSAADAATPEKAARCLKTSQLCRLKGGSQPAHRKRSLAKAWQGYS